MVRWWDAEMVRWVGHESILCVASWPHGSWHKSILQGGSLASQIAEFSYSQQQGGRTCKTLAISTIVQLVSLDIFLCPPPVKLGVMSQHLRLCQTNTLHPISPSQLEISHRSNMFQTVSRRASSCLVGCWSCQVDVVVTCYAVICTCYAAIYMRCFNLLDSIQ